MRGWVFFLWFFLSQNSWSDVTITGKVPFDHGTLSFQVHGSPGQLETMNAVKHILERDRGIKELLDYFRYQPRRDVHFYVDGKARLFNGYAMAAPHSFISLFNSPPLHQMELAKSDQWFTVLVLHELTHILHMDQTRGVFAFLRGIFGSLIVPGVIVPRWVVEGVAVWAESRFTSHGRLNSPLFKNQLYWKLQRGGFCQEIGCLDSPGDYPYGSYPYWIGGFFFDHLERKQPGVIRCLVEANSSLFPFFINSAFKECTGQGAVTLLAEFRREFMEEYEREGERRASDALLPHWDQISWFSGTLLKDQTLFYIYWKEREQFVGAYSFETKKFRSWVVPTYVEGLTLQGESVTVEGYQGQDERGRRRSYRLQGEEFVATPPRDGFYRFSGGGEVVNFNYHSSQWTLSNGSGREHKFPRGYWIVHPELYLGKIYFKLARERGGPGEVVVLDPRSLQMQTLFFTEKANTSFVGSCGGSVYLLESSHRDTRLVQLAGEEQVVSWPVKGMLVARFSPQGVFILERGGPHFSSQSCRDYLAQLGGKRSLPRKKQRVGGQSKSRAEEGYHEPKGVRPYLSFKHFIPQYWFFHGSASGGLDSTVFRTQLTDPKGIHSFDPVLRYYSTNGRFTPEMTYTYRPRSFFLGGSYKSSYYKHQWSTDDEQEREGLVLRNRVRIFTGYQFLGEESWSYIPSISLSQREEKGEGFSFRRHDRKVAFDQRLFWNKQRRHQRLDHFFLRSALGSFYGLGDSWFGRMKMAVGWNVNPAWRIRGNGGYSHVFKGDSEGAFVYGGGVLSSDDFHPFHGIEADGVYGSTIASGGGDLYHRWATPYSQSEFFPFQWQEIGGVLGFDSIRSDKMSIGEKFYAERGTARSYYGGVRSQVKLLYMAQINLDLLVFVVHRDEFSQEGVSLFLSGVF